MGKESATLFVRVKADAKDATKDLKNFYAVATNAKKQATREDLRLGGIREREAEKTRREVLRSAAAEQQAIQAVQRTRYQAWQQEKALYREREREAKRQKSLSFGAGFQSALASSRFAAPGTGGALMPLVGQTLRGGAGGAAGLLSVAALASLASGVSDAVKQAASLEQTLNVLQAQSGATDGELAKLRDTARGLGADITLPKASSLDAARAMLELSKAGLSLEDTMGGVRGALLLAAAAQTDAGEAARLIASQLKAFKLEGAEAARVADLLAATANNSLGEISDMGDAAQQAAAVFAAAKIPIEDMYTAIGLMANAGIKGSDAGTSLKVALIALEAPTNEAKKAMDALGVQIYDARGKMLPFRDIIGSVSQGVAGLTQEERDWALKTIFGTDALRAANVVLAEGADNFDEMGRKVREAGNAQKLADANTRGFKGAVEGLNNALSDFKERAAAPFLNFLSEGVKTGTEFINFLREMNLAGTELGDAPWWVTVGRGISGLISGMREYLGLSARLASFNASPAGRIGNARSDLNLFKTVSDGPGMKWTPELQEAAQRYGVKFSPNWSPADLRNAIDAARARAGLQLSVDLQQQTQGRQRSQLEKWGKGATADYRASAGQYTPTPGPINAPTPKAKKDALARLRAGRTAKAGRGGAQAAERKAAAARQRALMDRMGAATSGAQGGLEALSYNFSESLGLMDNVTDEQGLQFLAAVLRAQADEVAKQQRRVAVAQKDQSVASDPANSRQAGADYRRALGTAGRDRQGAEDRIGKAVADARKRMAEAAGQRAEQEEKRRDLERQRYERDAKSYREYLDLEAGSLRDRVATADSLEDVRRFSGQLADVQRRQAGLAMQQGVYEAMRTGDLLGAQNSIVEFALSAQKILEEQRRREDQEADRRGIDLTDPDRYPRSGEEAPDATGSRRRGRTSEQMALEDAFGTGFGDLLSDAAGGGRSRESLAREFAQNVFATARNEAGSAISQEAGRVITRDLKPVFDDLVKGLGVNVKGLNLSAENLIGATVAIHGVVALLGGRGKAKQAKAGIGGLLGLAVGSLIPGGNLLTDFALGAGLGGMFAEGGEPPVGRMSWVGERGPELFVPKQPGTILNAEQIAAVGQAMGGGGGTTNIYVDTINNAADENYLLRRVQEKQDAEAGFLF